MRTQTEPTQRAEAVSRGWIQWLFAVLLAAGCAGSSAGSDDEGVEVARVELGRAASGDDDASERSDEDGCDRDEDDHDADDGSRPNARCETKAPYRVNVLSIRYFPVSGDVLDDSVTGVSESLSTIRAKVDRLNRQLERSLEEGTTYHGYRNPKASCSIDYQVIKDVEYLEALPLSDNEVPWNPGMYRPDYNAILFREEICKLVKKRRVSQVWLWGYHHGNVEPAESNMASRYGDWSNSERVPNDMPICSKTYVLYNYNYGRDLGEALEDHGHQLEVALDHVDRDGLFAQFVNPYGLTGGARNRCGSIHFPPNGQTDYDWYNPLVVSSDCASWSPHGDGALDDVSCATWRTCVGQEDSGAKYKVWWMQNLPGKKNRLSYRGQRLLNWWKVTADFDEVMESGTGLLRK